MKSLALFAICLIVVSASAQKLDVTAGPVLDIKALRKDLDIPLIMFGGTSSIRSDMFFDTKQKKTFGGIGMVKKSYKIAVFDNYVNYSGHRELSFESADVDRFSIVNFVDNGAKRFVVYTIVDKDKDDLTLYANELSNDMVALGSPIILKNFKNKKKGDAVMYQTDGKNHIFIRVVDAKEGKQKLDCKAFDSSMNSIWDQEVILNRDAKDFTLSAIASDKAANIYIYSKSPKELLTSYNWQLKAVKDITLPSAEGQFGTEARIVGDKLVMIRLTQADKKTITCSMSQLDIPTGAFETKNVPLPEDFLKTANFKAMEPKYWRVAQIIGLPNGNVVFTLEGRVAFYQGNRYAGDGSNSAYVIAVGSDGSPKWTNKVRKNQRSAGQLVGHKMIAKGNTVLFFYNDHPKNISRAITVEDVEAFGGFKEVMMVVQEFDENGKASKYQLSKAKELDSYQVNLEGIQLIEGDLYYAPTMSGRPLDPEPRNILIKVN